MYFLSKKSLNNFNLQYFTKRKSGSKVNVLRSDNGGEYISNELNMYCEDVGIDKNSK